MTRRCLLTLLAAIALPWLLFAAPAAHASIPPHYLIGSLDLDGYCASQGKQGVSLDGSTAYDWHCIASDGERFPISFEAACRQQYGQSAIDRIENFYAPFSVSCWRAAAPTSYITPDISAYCQKAQYHDAVVLLSSSTAYSWQCADFSRGSAVFYSIDMTDVCKWASGGYQAFDRFGDFRDPNSWQCIL